MKKTILVTGAGGFVGSYVSAALLSRGHSVRVSSSRPGRSDDIRTAIRSAGADASSVDVVVANLESDEGWRAAAEGCDGVVHLASPLPAAQPKLADDLIRPARDGVLRVLAAARDAGVKRVVMTSSAAAIAGSRITGGHRVFTERDWTDLDVSSVSPYNRSKTIAERAARDDVAANGAPEFVSINPGLVLGPIPRPDVNASVEVVWRLLAGKIPLIPNLGFDVVDVRDVAELHALALDTDGIDGSRFPAASRFMWFSEIAAVLRDEFGDRAKKVPTRTAPDLAMKLMALFDGGIKTIIPELGQHRSIDPSHTIETLGWSPRPAQQTVIECAQSLFAHELV